MQPVIWTVARDGGITSLGSRTPCVKVGHNTNIRSKWTRVGEIHRGTQGVSSYSFVSVFFLDLYSCFAAGKFFMGAMFNMGENVHKSGVTTKPNPMELALSNPGRALYSWG